MAKTPPAKRQYVRFGATNHFEAREIGAADWLRLGAESATETTKWNYGNGFRVLREEIPLDDEQLTDFLATDRTLKLVEE